MKYMRFGFLAVILAVIMILFVRGAAADDAYLDVYAQGPDSVLIQWQKGTPLTQYRLEVKRQVVSTGVDEDVTTLYMPPDGFLVSYLDTGLTEGTVYYYHADAYDINGEYVGGLSACNVAPLDLAVMTSSSFTRSGEWIHGTVSWLPVEYAQRYSCGILVKDWNNYINYSKVGQNTIYGAVFSSALPYNDDAMCKWVIVSLPGEGDGPKITYDIGTFGDLRALPDSSAELEKPKLFAKPSGAYRIRLDWTASAGADSYTVYTGRATDSLVRVADVTNQTTSYLYQNEYDSLYQTDRCYRFAVAAWHDGVSVISNLASAISAPLTEFSVTYTADKKAEILHANLTFEPYSDDSGTRKYRIRYGKSGAALLGYIEVEGDSADLTFPLPDEKTSYTFAVTKLLRDYDASGQSFLDGPTARKTVEYDPLIFWYPGGSFVWGEIDFWPEPWNRGWIEDMLPAFAHAAGTGETMEISARELADLARTLAAGQEPGGEQSRMLALFLPDFQRVLKAAGRFHPSEAEAARLSELFRGVTGVLAGRSPGQLRGAEAGRYNALLEDILDLMGPAEMATPAGAIGPTPTPATTHPFKTNIVYHFNTPTPTPAVPR